MYRSIWVGFQFIFTSCSIERLWRVYPIILFRWMTRRSRSLHATIQMTRSDAQKWCTKVKATWSILFIVWQSFLLGGRCRSGSELSVYTLFNSYIFKYTMYIDWANRFTHNMIFNLNNNWANQDVGIMVRWFETSHFLYTGDGSFSQNNSLHNLKKSNYRIRE